MRLTRLFFTTLMLSSLLAACVSRNERLSTRRRTLSAVPTSDCAYTVKLDVPASIPVSAEERHEIAERCDEDLKIIFGPSGFPTNFDCRIEKPQGYISVGDARVSINNWLTSNGVDWLQVAWHVETSYVWSGNNMYCVQYFAMVEDGIDQWTAPAYAGSIVYSLPVLVGVFKKRRSRGISRGCKRKRCHART